MPTIPALAHYIANPTLPVSDGEYLRRFVDCRDEEAFAQLMNRNGPLVLRACKSVLRDPASIDDTFQTTFIQLARHAKSLTASPSLAGWLHKTAVRAAGALRRAESRRHRREKVARENPNTHSQKDLTWLEVRELIDLELTRLPEMYRLPLLLCYIEGLKYEDAAIRLGCSLGSLRGRLERGRQFLRKRLERRGLPAVALTLAACSPPAVSAELRLRTFAVVRGLETGRGTLIGWNGLTFHGKVFLAGCVAVLAAIGVGLGVFQHSADEPKKTSPALSSSPRAVTAKTSDVLLDAFGDPLPRGAVARLGTRRFWEYSRDFALSPDGKTIAMGDKDFTLLDAVSGQVIRHQKSVYIGGYFALPEREGSIKTNGIFWCPDGRGVALVGQIPSEKYLWDFTDPKDIPPTFVPRPVNSPPPPSEGAISCATVSSDGAWIAIAWQSSDANQRIVQIYPCKTGKQLRELKADRTLGPFSSNCEAAWFTSGGRELVLAHADHTVITIDAANGKELRRVTLPKWAVIAATPDGKFVAIIPRSVQHDVWHTGEEKVHVWDLTLGKEAWSLPRPGSIISGLAFTPDSKQLITSDSEFDIRRWDLATGKEVVSRRVTNVRDWDSVVSVSADSKRYATARTSTPIKVWDAGNERQLNPLPTHQDAVAGVGVSPDSRLTATVGYDGTMRVWNITNGKQVFNVPAPRVNPNSAIYGSHRKVAFTPDGRCIIFDAAGVLAMADASTGKSLDLPGSLRRQTGKVGGFSTDGRTFVTFSSEVATLWDWPTGSSRRTFRIALEEPRLRGWGGPPKDQLVPVIQDATLSPEGRKLVLVSNQQKRNQDDEMAWGSNSNECWDVETGKRLVQFAPNLWYPQMVFSLDGRAVYAGGDPSDPEAKHYRLRRDALASWDVATGTIIRRFDDPLHDPNLDQRDYSRHVNTLALSSDGRLLAVSEDENSANVWIHETASGRIVKRFEGHTGSIYSLAFTPDGLKLISVSSDRTGLVWDVSLPTFSDRKVGPLNPKELDDSWASLAAPDPVLGWRAMADLAGSPAEAVAFLAERLKPLPVPTSTDLDRIEKQLDAPEFTDREKAIAELDTYGPNAVASVKKRAKTTDSAEVAKRLTEFLERHDGERVSPLVLRGGRGIAVLEAIGSPDARKILAKLAEKRPGSQLGVEAAAALARLSKLDSRK